MDADNFFEPEFEFQDPFFPGNGLPRAAAYEGLLENNRIKTGSEVYFPLDNLFPEWDRNDQQNKINRFFKDAELCTGLDHPNIVKLLYFGKKNGSTPFVHFERTVGESLKEMIRINSGISFRDSLEIMGQVLESLVMAHQRGLIHRNLTPHNIVIQRSESPPIVKVHEYGTGIISRELLGMPAYSAPEQLKEGQSSASSDLYAWGLLTLECLTGEQAHHIRESSWVLENLLLSDDHTSKFRNHEPLIELLQNILQPKIRQRLKSTEAVYDQFNRIAFG